MISFLDFLESKKDIIKKRTQMIFIFVLYSFIVTRIKKYFNFYAFLKLFNSTVTPGLIVVQMLKDLKYLPFTPVGLFFSIEL